MLATVCSPVQTMDVRNEQLPSYFPSPTSALVQVVDVPPRILQYAEERDMRVFQVNAQRFFGPSRNIDDSWMPPKGSEIFVGRIPRFMEEPQLVPILELSGQIFQLRMMMDFSGTNRGYCFVRYFLPEQAELAVQNLDGYQIRPGRYLAAVTSVDNCRLVLGGMPMYKSEWEILQELNHFCRGVEYVWKHWLNPTSTEKGIVTACFVSHRAAAIARSEMLAHGFRPWGYKVSVDWAEPDAPLMDPYMQKPHVLRVENVKCRISVRTLTRIFNRKSFNGVLDVIKRKSNAFIFFFSRGQAEAAKVAFDNYTLGGKLIRVGWCDPDTIPNESEYFMRRRPFNQGPFFTTPGNELIPTSCPPDCLECNAAATKRRGQRRRNRHSRRSYQETEELCYDSGTRNQPSNLMQIETVSNSLLPIAYTSVEEDLIKVELEPVPHTDATSTDSVDAPDSDEFDDRLATAIENARMDESNIDYVL